MPVKSQKRSRSLAPIETVITMLEMTAPPSHYPSMPVNQNLALLKTRSMPLHFYRYLIDRVGRDWVWVNALRLDDQELEGLIHSDARDIRVLYMDGSPAGFFDLAMRDGNVCELVFFGLIGHAAGRGLARWFLGAAIQAAWSHEPEKVKLQTCTLDHPAALPLYQKLGFEPVGQVTEDVIPMSAADRRKIVMR